MTTEQALNKLFSERAWWKDSGLNDSSARSYKKRFLEGKLEIETQIKILNACGYKLIRQMQWEKYEECQLYKQLVKKLKKENAFWSYDKKISGEISDDTLIIDVLLHLDIDDVHKLFKMYPRVKIQKVWKELMLSQEPMYHGLNRFYAFHLFNIKNPDRYLEQFKNKHHKNSECQV
jgi:hypothetical protein